MRSDTPEAERIAGLRQLLREAVRTAIETADVIGSDEQVSAVLAAIPAVFGVTAEYAEQCAGYLHDAGGEETARLLRALAAEGRT